MGEEADKSRCCRRTPKGEKKKKKIVILESVQLTNYSVKMTTTSTLARIGVPIPLPSIKWTNFKIEGGIDVIIRNVFVALLESTLVAMKDATENSAEDVVG